MLPFTALALTSIFSVYFPSSTSIGVWTPADAITVDAYTSMYLDTLDLPEFHTLASQYAENSDSAYSSTAAFAATAAATAVRDGLTMSKNFAHYVLSNNHQERLLRSAASALQFLAPLQKNQAFNEVDPQQARARFDVPLVLTSEGSVTE